MADAPGPGTLLGYCTNVHAGATWPQTRENLLRHAVAVRERLSPGAPLPVGLWLAAPAARDLVASGRVGELRDFLAGNGLRPYTLNGFPWGDFHRPVVKHSVYEPDWSDPARVAYTHDLIAILDCILPAGEAGSISTLPVGWRTLAARPRALEAACRNLVAVGRHLSDLEEKSGRLVHLDLEPEPGCVLERSADVARFFAGRLVAEAHGLDVRRYLRVCHDICHAAVMFEEPGAALAHYDAEGIAIGKVQVSSALRVDFDALGAGERAAAAARLAEFREIRYLHQTVVRGRGGRLAFHDDLPDAFEATRGRPPAGEWRVHFHVPIHLDRVGPLLTTRGEIPATLALLRDREVAHWEVETYAWDVLPGDLRRATLAEGIAEELAWLRKAAAAAGRGD